MNVDQGILNRLNATFALLNSSHASAFPPPGILKNSLENALKQSLKTGSNHVAVNVKVAQCFVTAAVDIWHRGIHSFLISASLTNTSPIWASVCGYYSSHYSIRAFAHLLGYFHLFHLRHIVQLDLQGGKYICTIRKKTSSDREHLFYWRVVKDNSNFSADPLFTDNSTIDGASDVGHRDWSNYLDHLPAFPAFRALDSQAIVNRIQQISQISFSTPPIPRVSKFPDIESVQVVAYHRLVRFRQFVDDVVEGKNRFWSVHRDPSWARTFIDFQLIQQSGLASLKTQI